MIRRVLARTGSPKYRQARRAANAAEVRAQNLARGIGLNLASGTGSPEDIRETIAQADEQLLPLIDEWETARAALDATPYNTPRPRLKKKAIKK